MQDCSRENDIGIDPHMDEIRLTGIQPSGVTSSNTVGVESPSLWADVTMMLDLHEAGSSGDITTTVDYEQIARRVATVLDISQHELLEATAQNVAESVLLSHRVHEVVVTLHQHRAMQGLSLQNVSVSITRTQSQHQDSRVSAAALASADLSSAAQQDARDGDSLRQLHEGEHNTSGADSQSPDTGLSTATRHHAFIAMSTSSSTTANQLLRMSIVMLDGVPGSQVIGISPLYGYQSSSGLSRASAVVMIDCVTGVEELQSVIHSIVLALTQQSQEDAHLPQEVTIRLLSYDGQKFVATAGGAESYLQDYPEIGEAWADLDQSVHHNHPSTSTDEISMSDRDIREPIASVTKISDDWILGGMA